MRRFEGEEILLLEETVVQVTVGDEGAVGNVISFLEAVSGLLFPVWRNF